MRVAGLILDSKFHVIDHIAPFCEIMDGTILLQSQKNIEMCSKYYPNLKVQVMDGYSLQPVELGKNYDIVLHSHFFDYKAYASLFSSRDLPSFIYMPHGNSDKGFYSYLAYFSRVEIACIYGQRMEDFLKDLGVYNEISHTFRIGNLRSQYYLENKDYYNKIVEKEILNKKNPSKKTILYAPTWYDLDDSSSFFTYYEKVIKDLSSHYHLLVKPHPLLEEKFPGEMYSIYGKYKDDVTFITDFPSIYPLLEIADIYLGDFSSVGYDFLTFNRPMFFFNKDKKESDHKSRFLHKCGIEIPEGIEDMAKFIEENLDNKELSEKRKKIIPYVFDQTITKESIIKDFEAVHLKLNRSF